MEPFVGEIRAFPFPWAPKGWALCNGALMSVPQNPALFALLGTTYGGDGKNTFGLPDLRGRAALGAVPGFLGKVGGAETVALIAQNLPLHTHGVNAYTSAADSADPGELAVGTTPMYGAPTNLVGLSPNEVSSTGGGQPHANMQPFLVTNYCIATTGLFPPRQ